jgi:hypothetical protein
MALVLLASLPLVESSFAQSEGLPFTWDDVMAEPWWPELTTEEKRKVRDRFKAEGGKIPYEGTAPPIDRMVAEAARLTRFTPIGHRNHEQGGLVYHFSNAAGRVVAVRVYRLDTGRWIAERDMPAGVAASVIYEPDR